MEFVEAGLAASGGTFLSGLGEPLAGLGSITVEGLVWESVEQTEARIGHSAKQIAYSLGSGLGITLPWGALRKQFGIQASVTILTEEALASREIFAELSNTAAMASIGAKLIGARVAAARPGAIIDRGLAPGEVEALMRPWTERFWAPLGVTLAGVRSASIIDTSGGAADQARGWRRVERRWACGCQSSASIIASAGAKEYAREGELKVDGEHTDARALLDVADELAPGRRGRPGRRDQGHHGSHRQPEHARHRADPTGAAHRTIWRNYATKDGGPREKRSVHIGMANYRDDGLSDLPGAANDANVMAGRLGAKGFERHPQNRRAHRGHARGDRRRVGGARPRRSPDRHVLGTWLGRRCARRDGHRHQGLGRDAALQVGRVRGAGRPRVEPGRAHPGGHRCVPLGNATDKLEKRFEQGLVTALQRASGRRRAAAEIFTVVRDYVRYFERKAGSMDVRRGVDRRPSSSRSRTCGQHEPGPGARGGRRAPQGRGRAVEAHGGAASRCSGPWGAKRSRTRRASRQSKEGREGRAGGSYALLTLRLSVDKGGLGWLCVRVGTGHARFRTHHPSASGRGAPQRRVFAGSVHGASCLRPTS